MRTEISDLLSKMFYDTGNAQICKNDEEKCLYIITQELKNIYGCKNEMLLNYSYEQYQQSIDYQNKYIEQLKECYEKYQQSIDCQNKCIECLKKYDEQSNYYINKYMEPLKKYDEQSKNEQITDEKPITITVFSVYNGIDKDKLLLHSLRFSD